MVCVMWYLSCHLTLYLIFHDLVFHVTCVMPCASCLCVISCVSDRDGWCRFQVCVCIFFMRGWSHGFLGHLSHVCPLWCLLCCPLSLFCLLCCPLWCLLCCLLSLFQADMSLKNKWCTYPYTHTHTHTCAHAHTHTHTQEHTHTNAHTHTLTHMSVCVCG